MNSGMTRGSLQLVFLLSIPKQRMKFFLYKTIVCLLIDDIIESHCSQRIVCWQNKRLVN